jgi:hypothetical protein
MTNSPRGGYYTPNELQTQIDNLIVVRFPSAAALRENAEIITDLLRDSIENYAIRTGFAAERFEEAYRSAVRITLTTLDKPALRGVCRFKSMPVGTALRWLKSRLLNNVKTVLTNPNSAEFLGHLDREEVESVTFGNAETEAEIAGLGREQALEGLIKLFKAGEDTGTLEYLADRLGIDLEEVVGAQNVPVVCEKTLNGNAQMAFDF